MNVGKPPVITHHLFNIKELIVERNPIYIRIVGRHSEEVHTLPSIRELMLGKSLIDIMNVEELSLPTQLLHIKGFTLEKNPVHTVNVGKASWKTHPLLNISKFILERNPVNVMNVEKHLVTAQSWSDISSFTL